MNLQFSAANLFGGLIFGSIGMCAFMYGKKQAEWKPMAIGILLMAFPYFVTNNLALYGLGSLLTILLFF